MRVDVGPGSKILFVVRPILAGIWVCRHGDSLAHWRSHRRDAAPGMAIKDATGVRASRLSVPLE
jgi:hypothetical protein